MIKILLVGMTHNPGGLETYMINIFSKLQGKNFQFYFIDTSNQPIAYEDYIRKNGGVIFHIHMDSGFFKYFTRYHIVKKFFKQHHEFNIIHINALDATEAYWARAALKYNMHVIFQSHESGATVNKSFFGILQRYWSKYNQKYLNAHTDIIKLAASNSCGNWMFGSYTNFEVINNGIDINLFKPNYSQRCYLKHKLHLLNNKVIITTARIYKQKNYPKIIKVFKHIHNHNHNTRLVIIGSGEDIGEIKELINSLNISKVVIFLGVQSKGNIARLLNIGDLMIMPSFYEAIPFSLTEAQAVGVPSLVSKYRIPSTANITGYVHYLSLKDSDSIWAKVALSILNNPFNLKLRNKMNESVRQSKFNIDSSINKIKKIYLNSCN